MHETAEKLYFSTVSEDRGEYFVEYSPPKPGYPFAFVGLTFTRVSAPEHVARSMEFEAREWLARYPIPVFVSAFDEADNLIDLSHVKSESHLIAYIESGGNEPAMYWQLLQDSDIPNDALDQDLLLRVYKDVPHKMSSVLQQAAIKSAKQFRLGWSIVFFWFAIIPIIWTVTEFFGPQWLGVLVFAYSLGKGIVGVMKMLGKWPKSARELAKEKEAIDIKHHHYHCAQNPDGFIRLRNENFERWAREDTQKKSTSLKRTS